MDWLQPALQQIDLRAMQRVAHGSQASPSTDRTKILACQARTGQAPSSHDQESPSCFGHIWPCTTVLTACQPRGSGSSLSTKTSGPWDAWMAWSCPMRWESSMNGEVVRLTGLEPAHPCGRQDLNLLRLPISPQSHEQYYSLAGGSPRERPREPSHEKFLSHEKFRESSIHAGF